MFKPPPKWSSARQQTNAQHYGYSNCRRSS